MRRQNGGIRRARRGWSSRGWSRSCLYWPAAEVAARVPGQLGGEGGEGLQKLGKGEGK